MTDNESAKPRLEVVEETQESLEVIEQARMPRPVKMESEARLLEGANEARFVEREFVRRRPEPLGDIRAAVDALAQKPVEFPEARPPPAPLPPAPAPEPEPPAIPDELRAALEPVVDGPLRAVEVVHRETTGNVVEATYERADGSTAKALYVVTDGEARPFDDIAARIDALPTPTTSAPLEDVAPSPAPEPAPEEEPAKKRGKLLGRLGKKDTTEAPAPEAEPSAEPAPEKKGGLLGRFGKKREPAAPAEAPAAPDEEAKEDAPKKGLLGRLGRKKKSDGEAAEATSTEAEVAQETPVEEPPSKKRFSLRRK